MERRQAIALQGAVPRPGWSADLLAHARQHVPSVLALGIAVTGVLILMAQSLRHAMGGEAAPGLRLAFAGGMAGLAATAVGALPTLLLRGFPQRLEDSLFGLAAGMMLAASAFSLLLPGARCRRSNAR